MSTQGSLGWAISKSIARIAASVFFDLKVFGAGNIPRRGGALIVSNHQSYLDPVVIAVQLKRPLNYIAKAQLFKGAAGRWIMRNCFNSVPVRQGTADVGAVKETIQRLRDGHLLNMYPEGARTCNGEIGVLKKGVALVVRRAGVPIIPAVIVGAFEAWPIHRRTFRAWPIRVKYGPRMDLAALTAEEILAKIDLTLHRMLDDLRQDAAAGRPRT